jgi:ribosomal peptide maturation radical SAM protein 1
LSCEARARVGKKHSDAREAGGADHGAPCVELERHDSGAPDPAGAFKDYRIALVTMPFAPIKAASIQIGLLKSIVERAGFHADDYYINLDLAALLGVDTYEAICRTHGMMIAVMGEWLFSVAAFGQEAGGGDFLSAFPEDATRVAELTGRDEAALSDLRNRVIPDFLNACLERIDWGSYNVVGISSAHQQNVASLALARHIKQRFPHVTIVFGGANMEGEMGLEYMRVFPFIDYAVVGEGDAVFPELLTRLAEGRETDGMLGVASLRDGKVSFPGRPELVRDLDSLPVPDYSAYYDSLRRLGLDEDSTFLKLDHDLPVEGSRGCWWGHRSHCTFCGMNGPQMEYRSKSPERFMAELDELSSRHGEKNFLAVDLVMDPKYVFDVFGPLGARDERYAFFYTSKANLTREQIRLLAGGGLSFLVPGIESLNSRILKLMRKGVTKLLNVNLLRWCTYYGLEVDWKLLVGFPGERSEDYADQLATCRLITHTCPPEAVLPVMLERFSPNFEDTGLFPTKWRRPFSGYRYIYPERLDLEKATYFFEYEPGADVLPREEHLETQEFVTAWKDLWRSERRPTLTYRRTESGIVIRDTRFGSNHPRILALTGLDADVYEAFSAGPRMPAQVCSALATERVSHQHDEEAVIDACETLCDSGLMIGEAGKYLSLAIPAEPEL